MKRLVKISIVVFVILYLVPKGVCGQGVKTNLPFILVGCPNIGAEFNISKRFSVSGDMMWMPYLFKKNEEVFRSLNGSVELRYYVEPRYYYSNNMYDGFYLGPYLMAGDFNIGLKTNDAPLDNFRREGWGISTGVSIGYKTFLSKRFRLDLNIGLGYAHLQYDKYYLGGEWAEHPLELKNTKAWFGPTKIGASLVYNMFR